MINGIPPPDPKYFNHVIRTVGKQTFYIIWPVEKTLAELYVEMETSARIALYNAKLKSSVGLLEKNTTKSEVSQNAKQPASLVSKSTQVDTSRQIQARPNKAPRHIEAVGEEDTKMQIARLTAENKTLEERAMKLERQVEALMAGQK